jgi:hypothetical protein
MAFGTFGNSPTHPGPKPPAAPKPPGPGQLAPATPPTTPGWEFPKPNAQAPAIVGGGMPPPGAMPPMPPAPPPPPAGREGTVGGGNQAAYARLGIGTPQYRGLGMPGQPGRDTRHPRGEITSYMPDHSQQRRSQEQLGFGAMDVQGQPQYQAETQRLSRQSEAMSQKTPPNEPDVAGGPIDRDQLNYQQSGMPEYMPGGMRTEQLASMGAQESPVSGTPQATPPPREKPTGPVKPIETGQYPDGTRPTEEAAVLPQGEAQAPWIPTYSENPELQKPSIGTPGGQVGEEVGGLKPPASSLDSQWGYPGAPNYQGEPPEFPPVGSNAPGPTSPRGGEGEPTYQAPGTPEPTAPGVDVSTATPVDAPAKPPGAMTDENTDVLKRNMEEVAGSQNPVDTSMRNVLSQVLEQGADIDAESLVPRLKTERERLASFREVAQRRLLSDLARRGFQLGGAQEAAVLAELEQQVTTATAQSFREIVNDERNRADARLTQSMQIASQQQMQASQLGLSREELAVGARLGYGQEQLGYGQLAQAGEALDVQARLGYGQERLGQEQLAVQQQLGRGQEEIGRGQLALSQEQLAAQERQATAQQEFGYEQLNVQERAALGEEALGYAGLDVQQQAAKAQAEASRQQLANQRAYQQATVGLGQYGAQTAQYEAETERIGLENETILRDLEMSQGFDQFLLQMGFDRAALEASLTMAEEGQTQQLLGMLNNYLANLGQGRVE